MREETGLCIAVGRLLYVEDLVSPECRYAKFWFVGSVEGGGLDTSHPEAQRERIVDAAWLAPPDFAGKVIYPALLIDRYVQDRRTGFPGVVHLPMQRMEHW